MRPRTNIQRRNTGAIGANRPLMRSKHNILSKLSSVGFVVVYIDYARDQQQL